MPLLYYLDLDFMCHILFIYSNFNGRDEFIFKIKVNLQNIQALYMYMYIDKDKLLQWIDWFHLRIKVLNICYFRKPTLAIILKQKYKLRILFKFWIIS